MEQTLNQIDLISNDVSPKNETLPLILSFLTTVEGATSGTTSGTWNDVDASDSDPA